MMALWPIRQSPGVGKDELAQVERALSVAGQMTVDAIVKSRR